MQSVSQHCKYHLCFMFILLGYSIAQTNKTLELLVLGNSKGACHPLWSQMLSLKVVKAHRHVSIYPSLYPSSIFSIFFNHVLIFPPLLLVEPFFVFPLFLNTHSLDLCHQSLSFPKSQPCAPNLHGYTMQH